MNPWLAILTAEFNRYATLGVIVRCSEHKRGAMKSLNRVLQAARRRRLKSVIDPGISFPMRLHKPKLSGTHFGFALRRS